MSQRLISQAFAFGLASIVTLAVLGAIDQRAAQPQHEALLAQQQAPAQRALAASEQAGAKAL